VAVVSLGVILKSGRDVLARRLAHLALRGWYRSDFVQPVLVALFALHLCSFWLACFSTCQLLSGLRLLWAKIPREADVYSSIQTATGGYLAVVHHVALDCRVHSRADIPGH
jgi:hypothetical protein